MSVLSDRINTRIESLACHDWDTRDGQVVPTTDKVYEKQAVSLEAVYLYADMADSTDLAGRFAPEVAARVIRMYLAAATDVIKARGGEIRSFDGDRVMGIFVGKSKRNDAAKAGLQINWVVDEILKPAIVKHLPVLGSNGWHLDHCTGVAVGEAFLVRGGVRGDNDLVSVGEAPNIAAKLSGVRGESSLIITEDIYGYLNDPQKYGSDGVTDMWQAPKFRRIGPHALWTRSSAWRWQP